MTKLRKSDYFISIVQLYRKSSITWTIINHLPHRISRFSYISPSPTLKHNRMVVACCCEDRQQQAYTPLLQAPLKSNNLRDLVDQYERAPLGLCSFARASFFFSLFRIFDHMGMPSHRFDANFADSLDQTTLFQLLLVRLYIISSAVISVALYCAAGFTISVLCTRSR